MGCRDVNLFLQENILKMAGRALQNCAAKIYLEVFLASGSYFEIWGKINQNFRKSL
jgi:hypothetical protein